MTEKEKKALNPKVQWAKCIAAVVAYLLFLYWVKSWWGLIVLPFIFDVYITKKINWQWWRDSENRVTAAIMPWVDALVFALVAVYFINIYFFQNYVIPSSSLEKSLLVGDYLFVSKVSYGPRKPQTPLTLPLTQHTLPVVDCDSYIEWPQWGYERAKGLGKVQLNDIVVFNYPAGDTVLTAPKYWGRDFYAIAYGAGEQEWAEKHNGEIPYFATKQQQYDFFAKLYAAGRKLIDQNPSEFGTIKTRPVDRRENYVKRCVGLPGQTLQIKNRIIYLDGKPNKEPDNVQYSYHVKLRAQLPLELIDELGISNEDIASLNMYGYLPLTNVSVKALRARKDVVESVTPVTDADNPADVWSTYPLNGNKRWTRDNYGPIWIPKRGATLTLTMDNIAVYERPIRVYEGNDLQVKNGKIYINGKQTNKYTFRMDYYWMQGDNRHNSADSRYWGFVPEDHIVGKPIFIWWSSDPDHTGTAGIRWSRLFRFVENIK